VTTSALDSAQAIHDLIEEKKAVRAWIDPDGVAYTADAGHERFRSDETVGYGHYALGWLRFYAYQGPKAAEIGFEARQKPNSVQRATVQRIIELVSPQSIWTVQGPLFPIEYSDAATMAETVAERCNVYGGGGV
jgi:hypothetical protein